MQVFVNNKEVDTQATTLSTLIEQLGMPAAVDNKMVPRTQWADFPLTAGAKVTIIKAACGG